MPQLPKVTIVGSGNVGATATLYIAERGLADVVMVDIKEGVPQAKAMGRAARRQEEAFHSVDF